MNQESKATTSKINLNQITSLADIHKISEDQLNYPEQFSILSIEANINLANLNTNENFNVTAKKLGYDDKQSKFNI